MIALFYFCLFWFGWLFIFGVTLSVDGKFAVGFLIISTLLVLFVFAIVGHLFGAS